jgi:hypothetical protein
MRESCRFIDLFLVLLASVFLYSIAFSTVGYYTVMLLFLHCEYSMLAMSIGLLQGRPSMSPLTTLFNHQWWLLHIIGTLCSSFVDWIIWCIEVNFCLYLLLVFSKNKKAQMWESCVIADVAGYITQEGQRKVKQMWCHQLMFWSVHTLLLRMVEPSSSSFSCVMWFLSLDTKKHLAEKMSVPHSKPM